MNMIRHTFLALAVGSVFIAMPKAHAATSGSFSGFMNKITGKTGTVGVGTGGVPVITTPTRDLVAGGGWAQAGNFGVAGAAQAADGFVLGGSGAMTIGGKSVQYAGKATISKESVAAVAVGCLTGGIAGCAVGVGTAALPFALEWLSNAGGRLNPETGALERKPAPQGRYRITRGSGVSQEFDSLESGCKWAAAGLYFQPGTVVRMPASDATGKTGECIIKDGTGAEYGASWLLIESPAPTDYEPSSVADMTSAMTQAPADPRVVKELAERGAPVEQLEPGELADPVNRPKLAISPWTVDGPAEVLGPKVDTVQSDGKKITSQEKTGYTYNGDKITQGPTTTTKTTTTTNPDGTTSTSTDTTTTTKGEDTPDETPTDTPLPDLPKLYERKYPDGIVGIWNTKSEQIKQAPLLHVASDLMPNVGSGGSCPTFTIPLDLAQWASYGSSDVSPPCWIWDFGKAVVIVSAMLLARALVFGG